MNYCPYQGMTATIQCPDDSLCDASSVIVQDCSAYGWACLKGAQLPYGYSPLFVDLPNCTVATCNAEAYCCDQTPVVAKGPDGSCSAAVEQSTTDTGSVSPAQCPCGSYCSVVVKQGTETLQPKLCPKGSYCPVNTYAAPIPCSEGHYCPKAGMCNQTICPCGFICPRSSLTAPQACVAPYYCPNPGAISQTLCPVGSYCPYREMCSPLRCPLGSLVSGGGKIQCDKCTAGRYCPDVTTSLICPPGSYCPEASSQPIPCPAGSFCHIGSYQPTPCPAGFYCKPGASVKTLCPQGSFCPAKASSPSSGTASHRSSQEFRADETVRKVGEKAEAKARSDVSALDAGMYAAASFATLIISGVAARQIYKSTGLKSMADSGPKKH